MDIVEASFMASEITIEQSHQDLYDALQAVWIYIEFYEDLQLDAIYPRLDSPRVQMIRQALINARILLGEMSDGESI